MAVALRSSSITGTSDGQGSSIAVPVPAGAAANDVALVAIEMWWDSGADPTVTPAPGFTMVINEVRAATGNQRLKVFWKRLSGADSGSWTFTWDLTQWRMAHALLVTGAALSGDPIAATNTATAVSASQPDTSLSTVTEPFLAHFVANANATTQDVVPSGYTEERDGDYLKSNYRVPGTTGTHIASGGTVSASTALVVGLLAVAPEVETGVSGTLAATAPVPSVAATASVAVSGTVDPAAPLPAVSVEAGAAARGTLSATAPVPVVSLSSREPYTPAARPRLTVHPARTAATIRTSTTAATVEGAT